MKRRNQKVKSQAHRRDIGREEREIYRERERDRDRERESFQQKGRREGRGVGSGEWGGLETIQGPLYDAVLGNLQ